MQKRVWVHADSKSPNQPGRDFVHAWDESEPVDFVHAGRHIFALHGPSRKHAYIILTPLNPTHIVKLGFAGVYPIIFLISAQKT